MKIIFELWENNGKLPAKLNLKILGIQIHLFETENLQDLISEIASSGLIRFIKNEKRLRRLKSDGKNKKKFDLPKILKTVETFIKVLRSVGIKNYKIDIELNYEILMEPEIISAIGILQIIPDVRIAPSQKSSVKIALELKFIKMVKFLFFFAKEILLTR